MQCHGRGAALPPGPHPYRFSDPGPGRAGPRPGIRVQGPGRHLPDALAQLQGGGAGLLLGACRDETLHCSLHLGPSLVLAGAKLQHEGNGLFAAPAGRTPVGDADRTVRQGMREESNVNSVEAMVDMIAVQRAYASVQKVMPTIDSARGIATTELGKPV